MEWRLQDATVGKLCLEGRTESEVRQLVELYALQEKGKRAMLRAEEERMSFHDSLVALQQQKVSQQEQRMKLADIEHEVVQAELKRKEAEVIWSYMRQSE